MAIQIHTPTDEYRPFAVPFEQYHTGKCHCAAAAAITYNQSADNKFCIPVQQVN